MNKYLRRGLLTATGAALIATTYCTALPRQNELYHKTQELRVYESGGVIYQDLNIEEHKILTRVIAKPSAPLEHRVEKLAVAR